jgi:flagellin-specific chaperone FliS
MFQSAYYRNQEYRQQDVMGASPMRLIDMAYDLAIRACERKDFEKAVKTIGGLRDALNFDYPEISLGLYRLYQWCLDCIRSGDYMSASKTLQELRAAWKESEKNLVQPENEMVPSYAQNYAGMGRSI